MALCTVGLWRRAWVVIAIAVSIMALFSLHPAPSVRIVRASTQTTVWLPWVGRSAGADDRPTAVPVRPTPAIDRAQPFLPNDTIDVEDYQVTLWLREQAPIDVSVRAQLRLRARTELDFVDLNAQPESLAIHRVRVGGLPVAWQMIRWPMSLTGVYPGTLRLPLRTTAAAGDELTITIDYTIKADSMAGIGALRFNPNETQTHALYTVTWPAGTRYWLPSNDHPSDGATFSFELHVPPDSVGAASGGLVEGDYVNGSGLDAEGLRVFRWRLASAIPPYAAAFAIGHFDVDVSAVCYNVAGDVGTRVSCDAAPQYRLPLIHYHAPILPDKAAFARALDDAADAVVRYAAILGPYPFEKLAYVTTPGDSTLEYASLVALEAVGPERHETIHMWWGDSVRIATWGDFWINEGITSYLDEYFDELTGGDRAIANDTVGELVRPPDTPATLLANNAYSKGAAAVYDLRRRTARLLGRSMSDPEARTAFHRVLGGVWQHFRGQAVRTSALTAYVRAHLAQLIGPSVTAELAADSVDDWYRQWVLRHRTTLNLRLPEQVVTLELDEANAWLPRLLETGPVTARMALYGDACNDDAGVPKPPEQSMAGAIAFVTYGGCSPGEGVINAAAQGALAVVSSYSEPVRCPAPPCDTGPGIPGATLNNLMEPRIVGWLRSGTPISATLRTDILETSVP